MASITAAMVAGIDLGYNAVKALGDGGRRVWLKNV